MLRCAPSGVDAHCRFGLLHHEPTPTPVAILVADRARSARQVLFSGSGGGINRSGGGINRSGSGVHVNGPSTTPGSTSTGSASTSSGPRQRGPTTRGPRRPPGDTNHPSDCSFAPRGRTRPPPPPQRAAQRPLICFGVTPAEVEPGPSPTRRTPPSRSGPPKNLARLCLRNRNRALVRRRLPPRHVHRQGPLRARSPGGGKGPDVRVATTTVPAPRWAPASGGAT